MTKFSPFLLRWPLFRSAFRRGWELYFGHPSQPRTVRFRQALPTLCVLGMSGLLLLPSPSSPRLPASLTNAPSFLIVFETIMLLWFVSALTSVAWTNSSIGGQISRLLQRLILLAQMLYVLQHRADQVNAFLAWSGENTPSLLLFYPALFLVWLLLRVVPGPPLPMIEPLVNTYVQFRQMFRLRRTTAEILRSAQHEAGHALLCAAFDPLPVDFHAQVEPEVDYTQGNVILGSVRCPFDKQLESEESLRLAMLVQLAGVEAEFLLTGTRGTGTLTDTAAWNQLAALYLACGFGGPFFPQPANDTEINYNVKVYNQLRETQRSLVADFLAQNRVVLEELAQALAERHRLDKQDVLPFFARLRFSGAMPRIRMEEGTAESSVPASCAQQAEAKG